MREERLPRYSTAHTTPSDLAYVHLRTLNAALERASSHVGGLLIDIGCGNKPYREMFPRVVHYIGYDVVQSSEGVVDIIGLATSLPIADRSADAVLCTQTIEHIHDFQALVSEAYRILKPGGHMILSGPMYWPLHEEPYDYFRFTKHGFRYILEQSGFRVIDIIANGGKWAVLGQVVLHTLQGGRLDRVTIRRLLNRTFAHLDDKYHDEISTINYVAIAGRDS